jgi:hypothetical protein
MAPLPPPTLPPNPDNLPSSFSPTPTLLDFSPPSPPNHSLDQLDGPRKHTLDDTSTGCGACLKRRTRREGTSGRTRGDEASGGPLDAPANGVHPSNGSKSAQTTLSKLLRPNKRKGVSSPPVRLPFLPAFPLLSLVAASTLPLLILPSCRTILRRHCTVLLPLRSTALAGCLDFPTTPNSTSCTSPERM